MPSGGAFKRKNAILAPNFLEARGAENACQRPAFCKNGPLMDKNAPIDISYVAGLARIELTEAEKEKFSAQLGQILGYFEKLSKVDVEGVEPCAHAHAVYNVWRGDEEGPTLTVEQALMNAPESRDGQIVVPKVVDDA